MSSEGVFEKKKQKVKSKKGENTGNLINPPSLIFTPVAFYQHLCRISFLFYDFQQDHLVLRISKEIP